MSIKSFYVYELFDPRSNIVFYVGKGTRGRYGLRVSDHIRKAIRSKNEEESRNKLKDEKILEILDAGLDLGHRIIFETYSEELAFNKEKETISNYGRIICKTGCLTNILEGGSGITDHERRSYMAKIRSAGDSNPMYGRSHTEFSKSIISKKRRSRNFVYKHTAEHRESLKKKNPGGEATSNPILQIDPDTGAIINRFESARKALLTVGNLNSSLSNITENANKKSHRIAYGYYWRWPESDDIVDERLNGLPLNTIRTRPRSAKEIIQTSRAAKL